MRTNEECYEYVLKRVGELEAQRRKRRGIVLKAAAPVCGIAVIAGTAAALRNRNANINPQVTSDVDVVSGEMVPDWIDDRSSANSVVESAPQYVQNVPNIGEVEIAEGGDLNLFAIPGFYEMTRDEVLKHFGLSTSLDLSEVVDGLYETSPRYSILNPERKHGFMRFYSEDENGVGTWEEIGFTFDNEEFVFESADGSKTAVVIFDHNNDRVFWLRSGILSSVEDEDFQYFSTEPFYALPTSTVAGVEMLIAHRNIGGYYAEFHTNTLSVGLITEGLSESDTVAILEYLAEYTGAADDTPTDVTVSDISISHPDIIN